MTKDFESRLNAQLDRRPPRRVSLPGARDAAVLIPIVGDPEPTLIFTQRTDHLPSHKGQISFPGGSLDPDDAGFSEAALREAQEEIGLDPDVVRIVGEMDAVPTFVSGFVVVPVVGWLERDPQLQINPHEVARVLRVPIGELIEDIRREPGFSHAGRTFPTEAWIWNGNVIWGATARILRMFLSHLAQAGLAAAPGRTTSWTAWPLTS